MDLFYIFKSLIPVALKSSVVPRAWFLMSFISERKQGSFGKCLMLAVGGRGYGRGLRILCRKGGSARSARGESTCRA